MSELSQPLAQPVAERTAEVAPAGPDLPEKGSTSFIFTNLVFKAPGAKFVGSGPARTPMFSIDLGDATGLLSINALQRQFNIAPTSDDGRMVTLAVKSLPYVSEIRPGDNVPNEILTGTASWSIDPRHTEMAQRRLEVQLLASVDKDVDKRPPLHDTAEVTAFLARPENKAKLRQAFKDAAKAMGRAEDDHAHVLTQIANFARELAYVEALREWFQQVGALNKKLPVVARCFEADKRIKGEMIAMQALLPAALREYRTLFTDLDAECSDVIAALTLLDKKVTTIREGRDKLHGLTLVWKDTIGAWKGFTPANAGRYLDVAQATYRFLASRHSSGRSMMASFNQPNALKAGAISAPPWKADKNHSNPLMRPDAGVKPAETKPPAKA